MVRGGTSSSPTALYFNPRRLSARLANGTESLTGDALYKEVSAALAARDADAAMMDSRLSAPASSSNAPLADESGSAERQDFLGDGEPLPDEVGGELIDLERRACWLNSARSALYDRELRIIKQRRLRDEGATLEELGLALGISKERVRQIEARAMEKLKAALIRQNPEFL